MTLAGGITVQREEIRIDQPFWVSVEAVGVGEPVWTNSPAQAQMYFLRCFDRVTGKGGDHADRPLEPVCQHRLS